MKTIEYLYNKKDILQFLKKQKTFKTDVLTNKDVDRRLKIKPNNPAFYSLKLELDDGFIVNLQHNNNDEFPKYMANLFFDKTSICRLDYHEGHRRKCKKEQFLELVADDLHLHLYCEDCIKEKFKVDAFILNIKEEKMLNFDFKCFITLFCKIINLKSKLDCQRSLFS